MSGDILQGLRKQVGSDLEGLRVGKEIIALQ